MATVTTLRFEETCRQLFVRLASLPDFDANTELHVWNPRDDDHQRDRDWLEANTPGWSWRLERGPIQTIELPIGANPVDDFQHVEVILSFASAAHRTAWRERKEAEEQKHLQLQERIRLRKLELGETAVVCDLCGGLMIPHEERETDRLAQFAFHSTRIVLRCTDCHGSMTSWGSTAAISEAIEKAMALVGLPDHGSATWTEEIGAEWTRRRQADPVASVDVTPEMTADDIIRALVVAISRAGGVVPGQPKLMVLPGGRS